MLLYLAFILVPILECPATHIMAEDNARLLSKSTQGMGYSICKWYYFVHEMLIVSAMYPFIIGLPR